MWVSPNHPNPPRPYSPPQESGQRLATFPRHGGEELRVNLAEYEGHPYVSLRVWAARTGRPVVAGEGQGAVGQAPRSRRPGRGAGPARGGSSPARARARAPRRASPTRSAGGGSALGHPGKSRGQPNLSTNSRGKRGTEAAGDRGGFPSGMGKAPAFALERSGRRDGLFPFNGGRHAPRGGPFSATGAPSPTSARRGLGRGLPFGQLRNALVTQLEAFL